MRKLYEEARDLEELNQLGGGEHVGSWHRLEDTGEEVGVTVKR